MKRLVPLVLALAASSAAHAQSDAMKGMDMKGEEMKMEKKGAKPKSHAATGVVKSVDKASGKVTIAHGPVQSMGWPAMNMGFKAKNKAMLEKMKPGEKVEFSFVQSGEDYLITKVK